MKTAWCILLLLQLQAGAQLKSIVYDFDGFDNNATSLPEGDYSYGDLQYKITAATLANAPVLGDRVLQLDLNWNNGYGAFGRGISRFIELSPSLDFFNFYLYLPAGGSNATIEIRLAEDDNQNNTYENLSDDVWSFTVTPVLPQGWQKISVPLSAFVDANPGGNGLFDAGFGSGKGMLLLAEFRFTAPVNTAPTQFLLDMICFSEGQLPTGVSDFEPPATDPADYCRLGAFSPVPGGDFMQIPLTFENQFTSVPGHRLKYINTYLQWSQNSTSPNAYPASSIQTLLNNGYRPILTWEPMYLQLAPLDPQQPKLDDIIAGVYDTYIDNFANAMKQFTDTVIVRFMHEFEGDWYPWCISQNGNDPTKIAKAFAHAVQRFRAQGATKIKWMWCGNSDYAPYQAWNWMVAAYPGDSLVDYVATDVYNGHYPAALPWWRSFRWVATESVYYLHKYFPSKPLVICELGCRARISGDDPTSQSKAAWFEAMDRDLQSYFHHVRGLVFFNADTGPAGNWKVNSDAGAVLALDAAVWQDEYYFGTGLPAALEKTQHDHYSETYQLQDKTLLCNTCASLQLYDLSGRLVLNSLNDKGFNLTNLPGGLYLLKLNKAGGSSFHKVFVH